jgi:hypothetical protein
MMLELAAQGERPDPLQGRPMTDNQTDTKAFHIVADMEDDLKVVHDVATARGGCAPRPIEPVALTATFRWPKKSGSRQRPQPPL